MEVPEAGQRRMSLRELEKEAGGVAESNQEHVPHVPAGTETSDSHRGLDNKQSLRRWKPLCFCFLKRIHGF